MGLKRTSPDWMVALDIGKFRNLATEKGFRISQLYLKLHGSHVRLVRGINKVCVS